MNLRQLSTELAELLAEHPEYADHVVLCEDGEFEVQGVWCGDAPEIWLSGYDGAETGHYTEHVGGQLLTQINRPGGED